MASGCTRCTVATVERLFQNLVSLMLTCVVICWLKREKIFPLRLVCREMKVTSMRDCQLPFFAPVVL